MMISTVVCAALVGGLFFVAGLWLGGRAWRARANAYARLLQDSLRRMEALRDRIAGA